MHDCLKKICHDFEEVKNFFQDETPQKDEIVNRLFEEFMECFPQIHEEKLEYPHEFLEDVRLYNEGFAPIVEKFDDIQIRYLLLSDFYDFARLTKHYIKE